MGRTYTGISPYVLDYMEEQAVRTFPRGADSNPARAKAREVWHDWNVYFQ
jgi:hypothetical protein